MSRPDSSDFNRAKRNLTFIDLFAGLGGFHLALSGLGHHCVFACEIDESLRQLYKENFGILPFSDIRRIKPNQIPHHDMLCAGFPCQPFSKAGEQAGLNCPRWGDLFSYVLKIIKWHRPQFLLLENVPNLKRHDDGKTWTKMMLRLEKLDYDIRSERLSPHNFGIPQIRERLFIVGSRSGLDNFTWPNSNGCKPPNMSSLLEKNPRDARRPNAQALKCLNVWQEFIQRYPKEEELPSFPIWAMEFKATYPYQEDTPSVLGGRKLRKYRGSFGVPLRKVDANLRIEFLPSHARRKGMTFPDWKVQFIRQNRELYKKHKSWINEWLPKLREFPSSFQKLEWNCKSEERNIWNYIIQFRASGVRVKRPTTSPSLVAMTSTQVPIVGWERRYLTPRECARLQSMNDLPKLPSSSTRAFKALGNAVNVTLVALIASQLLTKRKSTTLQAKAKVAIHNYRSERQRSSSVSD